MRFCRGPSSMWTSEMYRSSTSTLGDLVWALAMAERRTFSRRDPAFRFSVNLRMVRASPTNRSRMRSATRRHFWGEMRMNRPVALETNVWSFILLRHLDRLGRLGGVPLERPGGRKLPELVPDHVLGDEHRDELPAVVDGDGQPDHVRGDGR